MAIGVVRAFVMLAGPFLLSLPAVNICSGQTSSAASSTAAVVSRTLRGRVSNALTGAAVPKTLVSINTRAMLTDSQGNFEFREFTDAQATARLTKPGYNQTRTFEAGSSTNQKIVDLDAFVDLKIYPDAVVTGIVISRDGQPLAHVPVALRRQFYQPAGMRWLAVRTIQTDLQGEYRFLEPAGRFQVGVGYVASIHDTGEVLIPAVYPQATGSDGSDHFDVDAGQERHIDLRPRTSLPYPVTVRVDNQEAQRGGVQFSATTSSGDMISNVQARSAGQGDFQLTLPTGTFTLRAAVNSRDTELEGSGRVTVTGPHTEATVIHIEPAASIPVEVVIDPSSAANVPAMATASTQSTQPPDLRQFNLRLHSLATSTVMQPEIVLRQREDKTYEFRVPAGRYKMDSIGAGGNWFIESATYGMANLATSEIVIGSGGAGIPIRVVVNNAYGTVSGTLTLPPTLAAAWVYLIPSTPSLTPSTSLMLQGGTTSQPNLPFSTRMPSGSYIGVALDHQVQEDLRDPEVLARLSTAAKSFAVSGSGNATIDLTVSQQKDSAP